MIASCVISTAREALRKEVRDAASAVPVRKPKRQAAAVNYTSQEALHRP